MDDNDPQRYKNARPPMYTNATESGLSVPAVVNDVVFFATTQIALYAFAVSDGTLLMFPSYLEHSVDATTSEEERISISFNAMFSAFTATLSKPLW